jgi:hypothetical protein
MLVWFRFASHRVVTYFVILLIYVSIVCISFDGIEIEWNQSKD